jgi:hypothetical protein
MIFCSEYLYIMNYLLMGFCLFIHEIDILQIWSHFIMVLKFFVIRKSLVDMVLLRATKFECDFCYSSIHQCFQFYYGL